MKIIYNYALVVGLVALFILLIWYLENEDIQLCLTDTGVAVIPIPYTWVSKAGQPEPVMDGFPSTIKHPPKKGKPESEGYNIGELTKSFNTPGFNYPRFFNKTRKLTKKQSIEIRIFFP